ncbi:response regulator transcription factor [Paraburkholderia sp. BR14320]|uniref:response regulator transcription factor n=1 Tax=unclassified Paraburkholderia TaxID=2615204 RepID=UPI0034CDC99A
MIVSVVDDDESVRLATGMLLMSLDCDVLLFASAAAFLDSGRLGDIDCVISDVQMPGMDGLEMQRKLIEKKIALPIIFISAFGSDAMRKQAFANGAVCFLDKPVTGADILACLEKIGKKT